MSLAAIGAACLGVRGRPHAVDQTDLVLEVLELGRRADIVAGELDEVVGRQVAPARVADEDIDAAIRARRNQGRTRSASPASYQQSPARTTSTSGGSSSRTSRRTTVTRQPLARALSPIAATAKRVDVGGRRRPTRRPAWRRSRTDPSRTRDRIPSGRLPSRGGRAGSARWPGHQTRRMPSTAGGIRVVRLDLGGVPQRQDVVGQVEADASRPGTGRRRAWRRTNARGDEAIRRL